MADQVFSSSYIDENGRQLVLDDQIQFVYYYDASDESWDKNGVANQSWYREKFLPNDTFDSPTFLPDRWTVVDTPEISDSTFNQNNGNANFGVERDEGVVGLSSAGKWALTGDFEIRLYIDWSTYYNEFRTISSTFLKVGKDNSNAARVSFVFDGEAFGFISETTVDKDLVFFDWQKNGTPIDISFIETAYNYVCFKITRVGGVLRTIVTRNATDFQVGANIIDEVFSEDLYVEFGVETKEYNTYRHSFTKFFVDGTVTPTQEFFSSTRGVDQAFPERAMLVIEDQSLSVIDAEKNTLWMRFLLGAANTITGFAPRVKACSGAIYVTSNAGLLVFDLHRDKIFKYTGSTIQAALDPIVMRNSGQVYGTYLSNTGALLSDKILDVACKNIGGTDFISLATDKGVSVKRALTAGVLNSTDGELPLRRTGFSDLGTLYWAGYTPINNKGSLSYRSGVEFITISGVSQTFERTGSYSTTTPVAFFGEVIESFDVRTVDGIDLLAVGSSEGLSFLAFSPSAPFTGSVSYGLKEGAPNSIRDPSFENYMGLDWRTYYRGFHKRFFAYQVSGIIGVGTYALRMVFGDLPGSIGHSFYAAGTYGEVYQNIDFTGLGALYYDIKLTYVGGTNAWNFQIVVDDIVIKQYKDTDASFTKLSDNVLVTQFTGIHRLAFRLYFPNDTGAVDIAERDVYIDNLRTSIGNPDYRIMPVGNASIKEVLLQYDSAGHKVYFASQYGFGAVDLDDNSLDYFVEIAPKVPDADILSADFARLEDDET